MTKTFDAFRFRTEKEAEQAGEIYNISYVGYIATVTDPDGNKTDIELNHAPRLGLYALALYYDNIMDFIKKDMEIREKASK